MRFVVFSSPPRRVWFHRRLRTLSSASLIQLTMWKPFRYAFGVRAVLGDARVDPAGPVAGDDLDGFVLFVVDDHGDARVALAVAGFVHADRVQPVERRGHRRLDVFRDPMGDGGRRSSTRHAGNRCVCVQLVVAGLVTMIFRV